MADPNGFVQLQQQVQHLQVVNAQNNAGGPQPTPAVVPFSLQGFALAMPVTKLFDETTALL